MSRDKEFEIVDTVFLAGDEGFEPPISGPEPGALPLGQSPMNKPGEMYLTINNY